MNIDFSKNDHKTAQIQITVEPEDYKSELDSEYKKYQKRTNLKGFRKGKTPKSMVRKLYGPALLTEIVTKKFQDALNDYLKENEIGILGQPIPSEDQERLDFKGGEDRSFTFRFDVGLKPEVEIGGLDTTYHYFDTQVEEEEVDRQINLLQRRAGEQVSVEEDFEDEDILSFNAWELEDGEIKEDGLETAFGILVEKMADDYREKVKAMKVGNELDFDIYEIEKDTSPEYVHKYIMKINEEDDPADINEYFRGEIVGASRVELAELDEEFLTTAFGEEIKTEEAAREFIKDDLKEHFNQQADSLLFQEVHDNMMSTTEVEFPDEFLKRWMSYNQEADNEHQVTPGEVEENYNDQFRDSLKWQLISGQLAEKYDVSVEQQEILEELGHRIQEYMPGQQLNQEVFNQILQSLAQDQQQVQSAHNQIQVRKIFSALKPELTLEMEEINQEDFEAKLKEISEAKDKEFAAEIAAAENRLLQSEEE